MPDKPKLPAVIALRAQREGAIMNDVPTINAAHKVQSASSENRSDGFRHPVARVSACLAERSARQPDAGQDDDALGRFSSQRAIYKYGERIRDARATTVNLVAEP